MLVYLRNLWGRWFLQHNFSLLNSLTTEMVCFLKCNISEIKENNNAWASLHVQWTRRVKVEKGLIWFDGKSLEIHTKTFRTYAHLVRKFLLVDALTKITTVNYYAFTSTNMATTHKVIISSDEKLEYEKEVWKMTVIYLLQYYT